MAEPSEHFRPVSTTSGWSRLGRVRLPLWLALVVLLGLLAVLGWQQWVLHRAEAAAETERQAVRGQFDAERAALLDGFRARAEADADEARRQFGTALAWAVRGEMIRNNFDQIDQFFTEVVKLPHTERALLADSTGKVRVSTDRRDLGAALTARVPVEMTLEDAVTVRAAADGTRLLVVPIMGLNSRLGTVVVIYRPSRPGELSGRDVDAPGPQAASARPPAASAAVAGRIGIALAGKRPGPSSRS